MLEKMFKLKENKTTVKTEVLAGVPDFSKSGRIFFIKKNTCISNRNAGITSTKF